VLWAIERVLAEHGVAWSETLVLGDRSNDVAVCPEACDAAVDEVAHVRFHLPPSSVAFAALRLLDLDWADSISSACDDG